MSKEAYYFSHDANARQDEKILMLRAEHGWEGYGIYWALIEMMFESSDSALHHSKVKGIAVSYNIDMALLNQIIDTCIEQNLFQSEDDLFWSDSLIRRKNKFRDIKNKRSEAGKKGAAKRWENDNAIAEPLQSHSNAIAKNSKGKESKVNESKGKEKERTYADVIFYLNKKSGKDFSPEDVDTQVLIDKRITEGRTLENFKQVIDTKCEEWLGNRMMEKFLRPETLFSLKFKKYLNEASSNPKKSAISKEAEFQDWIQSGRDPEEFQWN